MPRNDAAIRILHKDWAWHKWLEVAHLKPNTLQQQLLHGSYLYKHLAHFRKDGRGLFEPPSIRSFLGHKGETFIFWRSRGHAETSTQPGKHPEQPTIEMT